MHQVSLRINSQPGSPCHSVPNPVFDTEPGPMSENEDGALSNTEPGPMANNLPASPIMSSSEPPYLPTEILSMIIACSLNQDVSRHAGTVQSSLSLVLRATELQHFTTKSTSERALQRIWNLTNVTIVPSEF